MDDDVELVLELIEGWDYRVWFPILLEIASDHQSLVPYDVLCTLIDQDDSALWYHLASVLLIWGVPHLPGAYEKAFEHARKAVSLEPQDATYKESLLFFADIRDHLLERPEAQKGSDSHEGR
jgi:hypothetical protein